MRKIVPFSGDRRKRVLDAKFGNLLAWVQIFREETCRAAFDGGAANETRQARLRASQNDDASRFSPSAATERQAAAVIALL